MHYHYYQLILCIICVLFVHEVTSNRKAFYGERCGKDTRCDSRASLSCRNGICKCSMEGIMKFDRTKGICHVLAGEKCVFTAVEVENKIEGRSWREEIPCVSHATCQQGFCTCYSGFYERSNGTCAPKRSYNETCENERACRDDQHLVCNEDKRCDCNKAVAAYDISRQRCTRRVGAACHDFPECVLNAYCIPVQTSTFQAICECQHGYFENGNGTCEPRRGHGENCQSNDYCVKGEYSSLSLVCNSTGHCACNESISVYDNAEHICRRKAGASCEGFPYCVENSSCGENRFSTESLEGVKCHCNDGYFKISNGTCEHKHGYGERCRHDDHCLEKLACHSNGICTCDQLSQRVYDPARKSCVGLADAQCDQSDDCITNAHCYHDTSSEEQRKGVCKCRDRYLKSSSGSCLLSHGKVCSNQTHQSCSAINGLICRQGLCSCKYEHVQEFDEDHKTCVSLPNGPCDELTPCATRSHCVNVGGFGECQCDKGLVAVDNKCQLSFGQLCDYTYNRDHVSTGTFPWLKCDTFAPLKCIEGVCQCDALQEYDRKLMKCKGFVGSLCQVDSTEPDNCVNGAMCVRLRDFNKTKGMCKCSDGWSTTKDRRCVETEESLV